MKNRFNANKIKVLFLTKYSRLGASSRLRSYQYFPYLQQNGIEVAVEPLFQDDYLKGLYGGSRSLSLVARSYYNRLKILLKVKEYDLVVMGDEIFPFLPPFAEAILSRMGVRYICDYDDAVYLNYTLHKSKTVRFLLGNKIATVMRNSIAVTAGNSHLAAYARKSQAIRIEILPTVVDLQRYTVRTPSAFKSDYPLVMGWIGTFSTFKYIRKLLPILEEIALIHPFELQIIGHSEQLDTTLNITFIEWTEDTEAEKIRKFDLGIMPLDDTPWEKGKCGYKLIQYMASGVPVIATGIGVNKEIVEHGVNGFIANNDTEWKKIMLYILSHRDILPVMGAAGRRTVEKKYSLQMTRQKLLNLLYELSH